LERVTTSGKNLGRGAMASLIAMINLKKKVLL
jgi:hypothetical protein